MKNTTHKRSAAPPKELRATQQQAKRAGTNKLTSRQIDKIIAEVRRSGTASKDRYGVAEHAN